MAPAVRLRKRGRRSGGTTRSPRAPVAAPPLPASARPSAAVPVRAVKVRLLSSKGAPPGLCHKRCWWVIVPEPERPPSPI
ncbi:hypothetical protein STENM223S_04783 [Streptomyces tendae]